MKSKIAWTRVILGGIGGGVLPAVIIIASTVAYDALGGSGAEVQLFMARAGLVIGIGGGFLITYGLALWAARKSRHAAVLNGSAVGALSLLVDLGLVAAVAGGFTNAIVVALLVRPLAGTLAGWQLSRRAGTAVESASS